MRRLIGKIILWFVRGADGPITLKYDGPGVTMAARDLAAAVSLLKGAPAGATAVGFHMKRVCPEVPLRRGPVLHYVFPDVASRDAAIAAVAARC